MYRFLKSTFVLLLALGLSNGIYLECEYTIIPVQPIGNNIYTCTAKIHPSIGERNVTNVSHNHLEDFSDADVEGLFFDVPMTFTPFNLHLFFPNLVAINMDDKTTSELTPESLKGLTRLRLFSFSRNQLQIIEPDLFSKNTEMQWINFDGNPIRHVAFNVFDHLELLTTLSMSGATCFSDTATGPVAVELLKFRILVNCPPTFEMLEKKIVKSSLLQSIIAAQIENQIIPINKALGDIVEEQMMLTERVVARRVG